MEAIKGGLLKVFGGLEVFMYRGIEVKFNSVVVQFFYYSWCRFFVLEVFLVTLEVGGDESSLVVRRLGSKGRMVERCEAMCL